jgi:hypothetical protein
VIRYLVVDTKATDLSNIYVEYVERTGSLSSGSNPNPIHGLISNSLSTPLNYSIAVYTIAISGTGNIFEVNVTGVLLSTSSNI